MKVKREYENGYWPKIEYWNGLLRLAIASKDAEGAYLAQGKLEYFIGRQIEIDTRETRTALLVPVK